jgi:TonB family protein
MQRNRAVARAAAWIGLAGALIITSGAIRPAAAEITMPKPLASCMVQPVYPEAEKEAGVTGTVLLNVEVLASGKVGEISAKQAVDGHPAFTASAIAAVGKWCFEPGRDGDKAVDVTVVIPIRYALEEKKK